RSAAYEVRCFFGPVDPTRGKEAVVGTSRWREPAAVLRALKTEAVSRDVVVGIAETRIVDAAVDADRPVLVLAHAADVDLLRLPGPQPCGDLFRIAIRIGGGPEGLDRHHPGGLMVALPIALVALEPRQDDRRPVHPDDAHHVAQHRFAPPLRDGLLERLREPVVDDGGAG